MNARRFDILSRHKDHDLYLSRPSDFGLGDPAPFDGAAIATDPSLSLHCLDFEQRRAFFVQTDSTRDLADSPFLYVAQFRHATAIVAAPFEDLPAIAADVPLEPARLVFLHSVGRCGSTLARNVLATQPSVRSLSEPDAFTQLAEAVGAEELSRGEALELVRHCVRLYCKPMAGAAPCRHWSLKFRSQCIAIADLLIEAYPEAKNLYITRDPVSWLESSYRAFVDPEQADTPEYRLRFERLFARMMPLIRQERVEGQPMHVSKTWLLNWIANTEAYLALRRAGHDFLELSFEEIQRDPEGAMRRALRHCGIEAIDWPAVHRALAADSQEGTVIARSKIERKRIPESERADALSYLERWKARNATGAAATWPTAG